MGMFQVKILGSERELLARVTNPSAKDPKGPGASAPRKKVADAPVTRPVYLDDERSRKAWKIAQQIGALKLTLKELEREYAAYSGVHSDPNIDLRQLMFPFAQHTVTVHA